MEAAEIVEVERRKKEIKFYGALRELVSRRCREDLFFLCKFVLGSTRFKEGIDRFDWHHKKECDTLMALWKGRHENDLKPFHVVRWPRGTLKSTIVSIGFPIWLGLQDPNIRILLDSENSAIAGRWLKAIKSQMEGQFFQELFGQTYDRNVRWNLEELTLIRTDDSLKEPTYDIGGVDKEKTSQHYEVILSDDIVGKTNSRTVEQVQKVNEHATLYRPLLDPGGFGVMSMTRWDHYDLGAQVDKENEDAVRECRPKPYTISHYACYKLVDGKQDRFDLDTLEFPTLHTKPELRHARRIMGEYQFSCNYLVYPMSPTTAAFKREWFRPSYHDLGLGVSPPGSNVYIAVDPAMSQNKRSDYTAIVVAAITSKFDIYILDIEREHYTEKQIWESLVRLNTLWKPKAIGMESVFKMKNIYLYVKEQSAMHGNVLPIREFTTTGIAKGQRIMGLQPFAESGKIHLRNPNAPGCENFAVLEKEFGEFDVKKINTQRNDVIDATGYFIEMMNRPIDEIPKEYWEDPLWKEKMEKMQETNPELKIPSQSQVRAAKFAKFRQSRVKRVDVQPLSRIILNG